MTEQITSNEKRGENRMGEDKNVYLTILNNENREGDDEIKIDFGIIAKYAKRFFALWLCLAIGLGSLSGASGLFLQRVLGEHATKAVLVFPHTTYDITKIKSPAVVGQVLNEMNLDILDMDIFRGAVEIGGLISENAYERLSMYYDLLDKNSTVDTLELIHSMLGTDYNVSRYVISFHYLDAKLSEAEGITFLNKLMRAYQDYCVRNYHQDLSMGNPLSAIDYREYDYAEAANIFTDTLENITSYLSSLESDAGTFRSTVTGLTFQDLHRTASLLRNIDLDRLASYIVIHSVSDNDAETEISYYKWRIEMLEQSKAVQRTRFNSLTDSINNYKKDDILIINGVNGNSVVSSPTDVNANYDSMIQEKLNAQASIASYTRSISYYQSVIKGFQDAEETSRPEDIALVRGYLESLNEKVNELIRNISLTTDEYYETLAFTDEVQVLIPATTEKTSLITMTTVKIVLVVEVLLFLGYCGAACILGIREANDSRKKRTDEPAPVTA